MKAFCAGFAGMAVIGLGWQVQAEMADAKMVDAIAGVVHDSVITYQEVASWNLQAEELLWRKYGGQGEAFQKELAEVERNNLDQLVERQLILHEFKTAGYNLPESILDEEVQRRIHKKYQDRMRLTKSLQAEGLTYEKYKQQIRDQVIVAILTDKNIASEIIISPHKVEAYYLAHRDDPKYELKLEDEVKLRMIVLNQSPEADAPQAQKLAEEILAKLKEGASFSEMASVYSQGSQRKEGGDWGWRERNRLNKGLSDVAFSLKPGERSGVLSRSAGEDYWLIQYENGQPSVGRHYAVETGSKKEKLVAEEHFDKGSAVTNLPPPKEFYLMLVEEKRAAHFKPLSEVRDQIEKDLVLDEQTRLKNQWIAKLKKKTFVRTF
jgi:peptidyl-prolyl cis-trans isomerase SurA